MERYEEASSNQYSEDVQVLLRVKEQGDGKSLAYNTHLASFKPPVEVRNRHLKTTTLECAGGLRACSTCIELFI